MTLEVRAAVMALPGENKTRPFNARLFAMKRLMRSSSLLATIALSPLLVAQQTTQQAPSSTDAAAAANSADDVDLTAEVQQLRREVERLRRELARVSEEVELLRAESAPAEKPAPPPAAPAPPPKSPPVIAEVEEKVPNTVFVLRDGHRTEAKNYAIIGQTVWIYTEQDAKKIPLADLDLAATKSANADHGVAFQLPPAR
jgi:hypothetical protein